MELLSLLPQFFQHLAATGSASPHTKRAYQKDLTLFFQFIEEQSGSPPLLTSFTLEWGRRWLGSLFGTCERRTLARRVSALRRFSYWVSKHHNLERNPMEELGIPKTPKSIPHPSSVDDTFALLAAPDQKTPRGKRDRSILALLYGAGLRRSELVGLDLLHLDLRQENLVVTVRGGKGKRDRVVPAGTYARECLQSYLAVRSSFGKAQDPKALFLNRFGARLSGRSVGKIVERYRRVLGLGSTITPHTLRHAFATHMLDGGGDLRAIQEMLGHTSLSTTQVYTAVSVAKLLHVYDDAHPHA